MEQWMNLHGWCEAQAVFVGANYLDNGEGSKAFMVQYLRVAGARDVFGGEPYKIAQGKSGAWGAGGVSVLFLTVLGETHFGSEVVVEGVHTHGHVDGSGGVFGVRVSGLQEVHAWMDAHVDDEWEGSGGLRRPIVPGKRAISK